MFAGIKTVENNPFKTVKFSNLVFKIPKKEIISLARIMDLSQSTYCLCKPFVVVN